MTTILNYQVIEVLYSSSHTIVYRAMDQANQEPVVLKLLNSANPTLNELVEFRHQYTITKNLNLPGIVQPLSLENYANSLVLVMPDFGGISLSNYLVPLPLNEFFPIAMQIAEALEELYRHRIIHKDIKPQNILINQATKIVKLIDFSIASLLPKETQEIVNPNILEGTLAYISPEQTGRMNRAIDYRTDFYSLGVTFYELLTGQLPFTADDSLELIHCHIARQCLPPMLINSEISPVLNDLIMKLLAKMAEDRYQSAFGLKYDLEKCWHQYLNTGRILNFPLATRDQGDRFVIPEKLYGREAEVNILLEAFATVVEPHTNDQALKMRSALMLVAGYSGIGKTAIINEIHKPIVRQKGYFIKGKYDQFQRDIPLSAWVQALQNLMQQILTESATQIETWKAKILTALGENSHVIIDVIPELELLIGPQPDVLELEGNAAQNRFNLLFEKFIRVFTTPEHPLVIFLDDLQWADIASLKLLKLLMSDTEAGYLLIIGAYRDNEVSIAHPFMLTVDEIEKLGANVNQIILKPLDRPALNQLIVDTLNCPPQQAEPLTELVLAKTNGNPFFATQFLKSLQADGLINFNFDTHYWQYDIAEVQALSFNDNVVEFMAKQLQKLPINTQEVLLLASCIGNQFDLENLAIIAEKSLSETANNLWNAIQEGLIMPIGDHYKLFSGYTDSGSFNQREDHQEIDQKVGKDEQLAHYKFLHDRVQQAAYSLIPTDQKATTHLKIGRLLSQQIAIEAREDKIFDIINHLNMSRALIDRPDEKTELIELNLMAARQAKISTAYDTAFKYIQIAIELLPENSWQTHYNLTLELFTEATDLAYLNRQFSEMEQFALTVQTQAQNVLDKAKVYDILILACTIQNNLSGAVNAALPFLHELGVNFPENPSFSDIQLGLETTISNLTIAQIQDLINLPIMTDRHSLAIMQILSSILVPAYIAYPLLFPFVVFKSVDLSRQYGNTPASAFGYIYCGVITGNLKNDLEACYQFGKLALEVVSNLNAKSFKARVYVIFNYYIRFCKEHFRETLNPLLEAYQSALENGDLDFAGWSLHNYCFYSFWLGKNLVTLQTEMANYNQAIAQLQQGIALNYNKIYEQTVLNLVNNPENPTCLMGEVYHELDMIPYHEKASDRVGLVKLYINKMILCYLLNEPENALKNATLAETYLDGGSSTLLIPIFHFYDSLIRLSIYPHVSSDEQADIFAKVEANQVKLQLFADHAPMNYQHKIDLVAAEQHRLLGENWLALELYNKAIVEAKEQGYIRAEAIGYELAAKFYLSLGQNILAETYMTKAYYAYINWGAETKVKDLEKHFPQLLSPILKHDKEKPHITGSLMQTISKTVTNASTKISEIFDFATVIKASQALSEEVQIEQLFNILMEVALENAGAEKGAFIWLDGEDLVIESLAVVNSEPNQLVNYSSKHGVNVLNSLPIQQDQLIPLTIINYVSRTKEPLVLNNAMDETNFAGDSYIINHQPKSVLCMPIVTQRASAISSLSREQTKRRQSKLLGIIYLENNLTKGAFTADRLEILKIIASQAAISLENARLYESLEDKVKQRTNQLAKANQEISGLNEKLKAENLRLSAELDIAKRLQRMVLPADAELKLIENLDIAAYMEPADEVGGDYYDILPDHGGVKIGIGDVTGHGLESGVLMLMAQTAVRTLQENNVQNPVQFMDVLNRTLYRNIERMKVEKNMTLALLDYRENEVLLTGQHEEIIVVRSTGELELIDTIDLGFPIGLEMEIANFIKEKRFALNQGDAIVLYSDGIVEAENINKEQYGLERLCKLVQQNHHLTADEIKDIIIHHLRLYIGQQKVFDDITLVVIKHL